MAYTIPVGAAVEIQMLGRLHGQRTRTTFHYLYKGSASAPDAVVSLNALIDDFEATVASPIRTVTSEEWTHEFTTAQLIFPVRYRVVTRSVNVAGLVPGQSCPSGVSVVVRRTTERSGRRFQGRIYIPGFPVTWELDSEIDPSRRDDYDTLVANIPAVLEGNDVSEDFVPIVSKVPPFGNEDTITATLLDPILRYQRRREIAVGE